MSELLLPLLVQGGLPRPLMVPSHEPVTLRHRRSTVPLEPNPRDAEELKAPGSGTQRPRPSLDPSRNRPPEIPGELWMLWNDPSEEHDIAEGFWGKALDSIPDDSLLVFTSEADAAAGAAYQNHCYDLNCRPVRVK